MKNSLKNKQSLLLGMTEAIRSTVLMMPQHGDTSELCQRTALINAINEVEHLVNGLVDSDLEKSNTPVKKTSGFIDYGIYNLNRAKRQILEQILDSEHEHYLQLNGADIIINVSQIKETGCESVSEFYDSLKDSINEALAYQLSQGFGSGNFDVESIDIYWEAR
jgi:hypothetical protein